MNLFTLFGRARAGLNLTPSERALLKLVQGLIITFLVAVCTQISALAATGGLRFDHTSLVLIAGAGVSQVLSAIHKLSSASGDPLLSAALDVVETEIGKYLPLHQQATPSPTSTPVVPVAAPAPDPSASAI